MRVSLRICLGLISLFLIIIISCKVGKREKLVLAISPYQDLAMIVNIENLNLEKRYNTQIELQTMVWEDILPAIASSGRTVDVGFASLNEFLTKENNINKNANDSLLFIYPAYIFKGGAFISFDKEVPILKIDNMSDSVIVKQFLSNKIGAQKNSLYEMMLYTLALRNNININELKIYDTPLNDGILAAQNGSVKIACAGLTQLTEAKKYNARVVLSMDDFGFADATGFVCKQSTLKSKKKEIEALINMWFDCVDYVMEDIDNNSKFSLKYLDEKAATKYTLDQYKTALSQEYFPKTIEEVKKEIISDSGKYSYRRISEDVSNYLITNKIVDNKPAIPQFILLNK
jgi:hypothetical protein